MMSEKKKWISYGPAFEAARVEERTIALPAACAGLDGRSLLFLSDVHLSRMFPEKSVDRLIDQVEALRPDMILMGGDYAESADWQRMFFGKVSRLKPPLGMFAVAGNNDCECFPEGLLPMIDAADAAGVTLLIDRTVRIRAGECAISVAGLDEFRQARPLRKPLFTGKDAGSLRILMAHYPHSLARYLDSDYGVRPHLCLAGHTHGGQYRLMGLTPYSIGFEFRYRGVRLPAVSGWKDEKGAQLLVSPGIGTSRLPFRAGVAPEIHLIHLESKEMEKLKNGY